MHHPIRFKVDGKGLIEGFSPEEAEHIKCIFASSGCCISFFVFSLQAQQLTYSIEEGVIISNQSLVLQKVTRHDSGHYQCQAANAEGHGNSNTVSLPIKCKQ